MSVMRHLKYVNNSVHLCIFPVIFKYMINSDIIATSLCLKELKRERQIYTYNSKGSQTALNFS